MNLEGPWSVQQGNSMRLLQKEMQQIHEETQQIHEYEKAPEVSNAKIEAKECDKGGSFGQTLAKESDKGGSFGQTVANIAKGSLFFVEILGASNTIDKLVSKKKISRKDILWATIPGSSAATIHLLQKLASNNSAPPSAPPPSEIPQIRPQIEQLLENYRRIQSSQTKPQAIEKNPVKQPAPSSPTKPQAMEQNPIKQPVPKKNPQDEQPKEERNLKPDWEKLVEELGNLPPVGKVKIEDDPNALRWLQIMPEHPRILILGGQDSGKSALAYYLLEIRHLRGPCYVYRLPEEGRNLIPPWLGVIDDLNKAPSGSTVLVDEAYMGFPARDSHTKRNKEVTKVVNLARQRDLSLIFVAHEARHIEVNILSGIDTLIMKKPGPLQIGLDRSILRSYTNKAKEFFQNRTDGNRQRFSYICFSPSDFEGGLENPKPSFWSEKLSKVFALGIPSDDGKSAVQLSKEEKKEKAKGFLQYGWSFQEIGNVLGVSKSTAYRYCHSG